MTTPNKDYRENCDRAIYVTGRIDQDLVDRLTPTINRLRLASCDPVTAYVDSLGGTPYHAETIRNLIKAPNPDGGSCRVITVVTGTAASAAADFLTLGDYAIAYPHSSILYHGTQRSPNSALTYEVATSLASSLEESNERFAVRLARRAFPRFCIRMSQFKDKFKEYISQRSGTVMLPITPLTTQLRKRLSPTNTRLVRDAAQRQKVIENLTISVGRQLARFKKKLSQPRFEAEVLKGIVTYKTRFHSNDPWLLSRQGLAEVSNDFKLIYDFHYGPQRRDLNSFLQSLGQLFLLEEETREYEQLKADEQGKFAWLKERAESRLQPLWYFVVSLCRLLQMADYSLEPPEAYWLGLVDEVCGLELPNIRMMVESLPPERAAIQAGPESPAPGDVGAAGA